MITEDYCSFEVAKLLKEKGFNEEIETIISPDGKIYHLDEVGVFRIPHKKIRNSDINIYMEDCSCPTLQMALRWLREVHKININILYDAQRFVKTDGTTEDVDVYEVDIITKNGSIYIGNYNHYESACEAAIKYCLTNLI